MKKSEFLKYAQSVIAFDMNQSRNGINLTPSEFNAELRVFDKTAADLNEALDSAIIDLKRHFISKMDGK